MGEHIQVHPVFGELEYPDVDIFYEGKLIKSRKGQTVAAALLANNVKKLEVSRKLNQSRGVYCNDGRCHSCYVTINGEEHIRACSTLIESGMEIMSCRNDPNVRSS